MFQTNLVNNRVNTEHSHWDGIVGVPLLIVVHVPLTDPPFNIDHVSELAELHHLEGETVPNSRWSTTHMESE